MNTLEKKITPQPKIGPARSAEKFWAFPAIFKGKIAKFWREAPEKI